MELIDGIFQYWNILSSLVSTAALGIAFYLSKTYVRHAKCEECRKGLEGRCAEIEDRCAEIEDLQRGYAAGRAAMAEQLHAMPKASDLHDLKLAIERLSGDIRTVQAEIKGQGDMLKTVKNQGDRMNSYLLEKH